MNSNTIIIDICDYREYNRFEDSFGNPVQIALETNRQEQTGFYNGLIIDDSLGGCGLIVLIKETPEVSQSCLLKLADLQSIPAKIIWLNQLDTYLFRLGVKYLI